MSDPKQQRTIGVVLVKLDAEYTGQVLIGIHEIVRSAGGRLVIFQCLPEEVVTSREVVDGWLLLIRNAGSEHLLASGKPCILVATPDESGKMPSILADNRGGIVSAIDHLVSHGHRRIAFVGCRASSDIQERFESYRAALETHGIAYDPALVLEAPDDLIWGGRTAGEALIKSGLPCSAVLAATDGNAIGLMGVVQAAGYRIPEDLAIVGFDNAARAQYTEPPLTTVSQRPDVLGREAALALLSQLDGGSAEQVVVPTALILRRSCGCAGPSQGDLLTAMPRQAVASDWREALAQALVQTALFPGVPPAELTPSQIWPGVMSLIMGLEAVAQDEITPSPEVISHAWEDLLVLTHDQGILQAILERLREAAQSYLRVEQHSSAWERVERYLQGARASFERVQQVRAMSQIDFLEGQVQSNFEISLQLLGGERGAKTNLSWLKREPSIQWGCLALWPERDSDPPENVVVVSAYSGHADLGSLVGQSYPTQAFPPPGVLAVTPQTRDHIVLVLPIRRDIETVPVAGAYAFSKDRRGVLVLSLPLDGQFFSERLMMWSMLLSSALEREELVLSLAQAKEAAEAVNRVKTEFLAAITHELRTPLNAILNFARFIGDADISGGPLNETQRHFQQRVLVNGDRLLALVNDILDMARIEENRMEIEPEPGDLQPLLEEVLATSRGMAEEKALELKLELADDLPPVCFDEMRVRQVLINLLSNAIKFTHSGSVTLSAAPSDSDEGQVCVSVHDTGVGIPPDKQHLVFESYRQIDGGLTRAYGGTGLGLTISKSFIELHGGRMWYESEAGIGTTFFFTLPIARDVAGG